MPSNAKGPDISEWNNLGIKTLIDLRSKTELESDLTLNTNEVYSDFTSVKWSSIRSPREVDTKTKLDPERKSRKERHFVSLMDEKKYVLGTISKIEKRKLAKVAALSPGLMSKRVRKKAKSYFLTCINDGGLQMVNDLILVRGKKGIKYVLELMSDVERHPVAFYCTAGKDRTGVITAIILKLIGVGDDEIVDDYSISADVYKEMDDEDAMVGALQQRDLRPEVFLGAPKEVMRETLEGFERWGGIEGYLDWIGFGEEDRGRLKKAISK
ncbi:hypothetical protein TrVE_jg4691 [Triparma verrucosa]|uniref:Tyrosine specific protein phosphatases domain-containing protein n=1 Tax=Triparma verrucosa TaxID=1606542 RepID=A0A9W7F1S3_9STRA|nr:hypothetical protein TrVE_jg4691 [Triparma verrucosa]